MKTIILFAAASLALASPTFAESTETAMRHFASSAEGGDGVRRIGAETSVGDVRSAYQHFAESRSGGDGAGHLVISSSDGNLVAAAKARLDNGERGDN